MCLLANLKANLIIQTRPSERTVVSSFVSPSRQGTATSLLKRTSSQGAQGLLPLKNSQRQRTGTARSLSPGPSSLPGSSPGGWDWGHRPRTGQPSTRVGTLQVTGRPINQAINLNKQPTIDLNWAVGFWNIIWAFVYFFLTFFVVPCHCDCLFSLVLLPARRQPQWFEVGAVNGYCMSTEYLLVCNNGIDHCSPSPQPLAQ